LAFGYRPECFLGFTSRLARGHLAKIAELYLCGEFTNAITPELPLGHESLPALADEHEKSRQLTIAHLVLLLPRTQARNALVGENLAGAFTIFSLGLVCGSPR
jgi:hypothetical protein